MTIQQRSDDAAIEHSFERLVLLTGLPLSNHFITLGEATNVQTLRIRGSATKAGVVGGVGFLKTFDRVPTFYPADYTDYADSLMEPSQEM